MAYGALAKILPSRDKLSLQANLPHARAEKELRETGGADLTIDGYYDLVLLATGSEEEARKRAKARRQAMLRSGQTPQ